MNPPRILVADDTPASLSLLSHLLEKEGYEILAVSNSTDALKIAAKARPDLVMLDVMMPGHDGYYVCRQLKSEIATRDVPVIFITSRNDPASIVKGFHVGAVDYIEKPFHAEEVVTRVATHLKIARLTSELQQRNAELEAEISLRQNAEQRLSTLTTREAQRWGLGGFVGDSPHLRRILTDIGRLQQFGKTSVLITGESGTGKELVARAIHHHSPRAGAAFIPVNCVAVPAELAESLFFGHMKGSFTGATADRKGYFELADGGTLFLDEIGDMPAALQAKLLRVLEDGEVTPVGATRSRSVDVRVLSATNANLAAKIAAGDFREDLFYRLARYTVETPPLRERRADLPLLATHFLQVFATETGSALPTITREAMERLHAHAFPGNIRELKNVMERALILSGGKPVRAEHLQLFEMATPPTHLTAPANFDLESAEQTLIQRALEQTHGNVAEAARLLNVSRSRIYRKFPHLASGVK